MMSTGTLAAVQGCVRAALKLTEGQAGAITHETTPQQFPQWTSMAHLELMLALERQFEIQFEAEEIAGLASIGAIVSAVDRHRGC